jgi:hypothetical protein
MTEPKGILLEGAFGKFVGRLREIFTDSIRYWEWRRIVYNSALLAVVVGHYFAGLPESKSVLSFDLVLFLFVMAAVANFLYCAAYPIDIFVQLSGLREGWRRWRWILFVIGTSLAAIFARWYCLEMFMGFHTW